MNSVIRTVCTFCRARLSRRPLPLAAALVVVALATACVDYTDPGYVERPVSGIYSEAMDLLYLGRFREAAAMFDEVERQHPYSTWATKAQLMSAYSLYQHDIYDEAIVVLDRFIQLHPSNRDVAYAHYLKALCYYEQISDVSRDQKMTKLALETLKEITVRYPDSKYARDAKIKLDLTNDHLAGKEMNIGRYYMLQGHYLAAINRFKWVVDNYQTTTHVPEALHRLTEAYYALGIDDEARKSAAVLGHNFPGSEWYIDSYETVEATSFRPIADSPWYDLWSSEQEPKAKPIKVPPPGEENWYKFWKEGEKDPKKKGETAKKEGSTLVKKPSEGKSFYEFWKPSRDYTTEGPPPPEKKEEPVPGEPPKRKDDAWYKFW